MGAGHIDLNIVFAAILAIVVAPGFFWFVIKGLRSGQTGPQKLTSSRNAHPVLFWTYLAAYSAVAVMCVAIAAFTLAYEADRDSETTMISLLVAALSFGLSFATMAGITGFYTVQGFRSGTSVLLGRGGPIFSDRAAKPASYWSDQVLNIFVTALLGTVGLGAIGVCLWFTVGALVLR